MRPVLLALVLTLAACRPEAPPASGAANTPASRPADAPAPTGSPETYSLPSVQANRPVSAPEPPPAPPPGTRDVLPPPGFDTADEGAAAEVPFTEDEVYAYLSAIAENDLDALLRLYGGRVRYYAWGVVGKDRIRADKQHYTRRWPRREYALLSDPVLSVQGSTATARFDFRYAVDGGGRHREGTGWTALAYRFDGQTWRIVEERGGTY